MAINIRQEWLAARVALQFLTRIPVPVKAHITPKLWGRSLCWYPLAGLVIGALLQLCWVFLPAQLPDLISAALILALWVGLTGALHLDGLADCVDAWVGGLGDRERTLTIMKDPTSGPMAVVALVVLLLVKFAALASLIAVAASGWLLLLMPVLARALILSAFLTTPYVRSGGLGSDLAKQLPRQAAWVAVIASLLLASLLLPAVFWLPWLIALLALFIGWRQVVIKRIQGFTGDCVGALLELAEVLLLVVALFVVSGL